PGRDEYETQRRGRSFFRRHIARRNGEICPSTLWQTANETAVPEIVRPGTRAQADKDRRGVCQSETFNAQRPTLNIEVSSKTSNIKHQTSNIPCRWFHRPRWRGQNDTD